MPGLTELPTLGHDAYWTDSAFAAEMREVFAHSWLFAGLVAAFPIGTHELSLAGMTITIETTAAGLSARCDDTPAELDRCGQLLFVRPVAGGPDLAAFLSPYATIIETISRDLHQIDHVARSVAPVKAPRWWPNSIASSIVSGSAAQFTATKGVSARAEAAWM